MAISSDLFNGVDLSRLPPPAAIAELSYEAVRDALFADVLAFIPGFNALTPADPAVKLLEYFAWRELLIRADGNDQARAVMLAFATGSDLDHLGALYNLERFVLVAADPVNALEQLLESDEDFRARIVRAPETFTVAGSIGAYVNGAKNASGDVRAASVTSPEPGEVLLTIQSRTGDGGASPELIVTVDEYLGDEDRRPLTDHLTVQSATIKPFAVNADVRTFSGPDPSVVLATAQARIDAWLAANLLLGRDITEDAIHAQLRVEGVSRVTLQGWTDVICDASEAGHCTGVTLNHVGTGE